MEVQGLQNFELAALIQFDGGKINEAVNQAIKRVALDLDDRPGDDRPRKVVLEIAVLPESDEQGICDNVKMQVQVTDKLPTRKTKIYDLGLRKGGLMVYQPLSLDDHNQQGLPFDDSGDDVIEGRAS